MQVLKIHETRMLALINFIKSVNNFLEVPVACAIYSPTDSLVTVELNSIEKNLDPTSHAEILAIKNASKYNLHTNLNNFELYTNLEPCLMCLGAIINSKISRLVFGAYSSKNQINISSLDVLKQNNPKIEVIGGVLESQCKNLMSEWFKSKR